MIIEQVDRNRIKVIVDSDEQKRYGITYETMTYCDCNTRKLCETIVEKAKNEVGFSVEDSKLLVEAKQGLNGTVTLFLSKLPLDIGEKTDLYCQTIKFRSLNDVLDSDVIFKKYSEIIKKRDIYIYEKNYYVYFEVLTTGTIARNILISLLEFCDRSGLSRDVLEEHGKKVYAYL